MARSFPQELSPIPRSYARPCTQAGAVVKLDYDTFEAFSYAQRNQPLVKTAYVYVPYGYDESRPYDVFYLMHGGWHDETDYLGTDREPSSFKSALDHAIAAGEIRPLLVVCPTYNNTSRSDSGDYELAIRLTARWPQELANNLIPAVESRWHTWAEGNVTPEGLAASRDHRAFGGFSMGSVTTWRVFQQCLAYFRWFVPCSGNSHDDYAEAVRTQGGAAQDFFLLMMTGTRDFAGQAHYNQYRHMAAQDLFVPADHEAEGNICFRLKQGYGHDGKAAREYLFNALRWLWNHEA